MYRVINRALFCLCYAVFIIQAQSTIPSAKNKQVNVPSGSAKVMASSQSEWLYKNDFDCLKGMYSSRYMKNDDPDGGKTCEVADDFRVPKHDTWKIESIRFDMYRNAEQPDFFQGYIYKDKKGYPEKANILYSFTTTASMPEPKAIYKITADVSDKNIVLPEGLYWLSIVGVYENIALDRMKWVMWNRKDTLLGEKPLMYSDSIGLLNSVIYPVPWARLYIAGEGDEHAAFFWIKGTRTTGIINGKRKEDRPLYSLCPNPASEFILFNIAHPVGQLVEIYDVLGKRLKTIALYEKDQKIYLQTFTNGIYFYLLKNRSGKIFEKGTLSVSK